MLEKIKCLLRPLINTPLHPQWLVRGGVSDLAGILKSIDSAAVVLDIGCFDKWAKVRLPSTCSYYGLDYLATAEQWYSTVPDIYGDALQLPIRSNSFDVVLLLDVLEHLADADLAIAEINRVLSEQGMLVMQVPFLYPLHDEPRDFARFTRHGFERMANRHGFTIEKCISQGHPVETATLLLNMAMSKAILNWFRRRHPAALLVLILPFMVLLGNLAARVIAMLSGPETFMPYSYQLMLKKSVIAD